jgi:hypothetical protein
MSMFSLIWHFELSSLYLSIHLMSCHFIAFHIIAFCEEIAAAEIAAAIANVKCRASVVVNS